MAVRADEALEAGVERPAAAGVGASLEGLTSPAAWRRVVDEEVGPGVRGIAKVLYEHVVNSAFRHLPSWRTVVGLCVDGGGSGSSLQQAGTWAEEVDARRVAAALCPGVLRARW